MAEGGNLKENERYEKDLPVDRTNFAKAWKLLELYSKIPPSEIDAHVIKAVSYTASNLALSPNCYNRTTDSIPNHDQRDKAFSVFHYPCIGRWRFLDLYITTAPEYPQILARLKAGEKLLDVGCCFGHIIRQLVFDGAPSKNLAGTDLRPEFVELGYELFRDKEILESQFVTGDALDANDMSLEVLHGKFDIVHTASFFHLFGWDDQLKVGKIIVKFFKPDAKALVVGRQVGTRQPITVSESKGLGKKKYHHDVKTFQELWDEIGKSTVTKWKVTGELIDSVEAGSTSLLRTILRFAVYKVI